MTIEVSVFSKIIKGELPAEVLYRDKQITAFRDIKPQAPTHILIVPNRVIATLNDLQPKDDMLLGHMVLVATTIARQQGIAKAGYRLIINCNQHGGQEVLHLHLHLVGGHQLGPMLCHH